MRKCDDCAICCDGYVSGEVKGIEFYPSKPCHFSKGSGCENGGCSIYDERPGVCKNYQCEWVRNLDLPEWMKPSISKVLVTLRIFEGIEYFDVVEAGQKMDSKVLAWMMMYAINNGKNIRFRIEGGIYKIGAPEFWQNEML